MVGVEVKRTCELGAAPGMVSNVTLSHPSLFPQLHSSDGFPIPQHALLTLFSGYVVAGLRAIFCQVLVLHQSPS